MKRFFKSLFNDFLHPIDHIEDTSQSLLVIMLEIAIAAIIAFAIGGFFICILRELVIFGITFRFSSDFWWHANDSTSVLSVISDAKYPMILCLELFILYSIMKFLYWLFSGKLFSRSKKQHTTSVEEQYATMTNGNWYADVKQNKRDLVCSDF